ncbi:MAG: hypothetical protein K8T91_23150 [Planctomycetes bacterium]|nr:hypothetical protein [Planctomycetota bacterium]
MKSWEDLMSQVVSGSLKLRESLPAIEACMKAVSREFLENFQAKLDECLLPGDEPLSKRWYRAILMGHEVGYRIQCAALLLLLGAVADQRKGTVGEIFKEQMQRAKVLIAEQDQKWSELACPEQ